VLDDGTTQLYQYTYDVAGLFNLTSVIDPLGRTTSFGYSNGVDVVTITQSSSPTLNLSNNAFATNAQFVYNSQHRPLTYVDAAGQQTTFAYNAVGELTSTTNPLGQTTQYQYDGAYNLTNIVNANNPTAATFTYDAFDRVQTFTDSEGWTVT
jgi:YD repeat-containing protein